MADLKRYELIRNSFEGKLYCQNNHIKQDEQNIKLINGEIPNFVNSYSDEITDKMSRFYHEVKFPNYDDFED